jgi:hypothetical protein
VGTLALGVGANVSRKDSLESIELWQIAGIADAGIAALAKLPHLPRSRWRTRRPSPVGGCRFFAPVSA